MSRFNDPVPLTSIRPFNVGLNSAQEDTMIDCLGRPKPGLTTNDNPALVSETVRRQLVTQQVTPKIKVTGIKPAIDSLQKVLDQAIAAEPELKDALGTVGMLNVRLRHPTSGAVSTKASNHTWGTAIDFNVDGHGPPGNTGQVAPRGIALLVPLFNQAGWYSGIDFNDTMHFEVAEETILKWKSDGLLGDVDPRDVSAVAGGGDGGSNVASAVGGFFRRLFG